MLRDLPFILIIIF